MADSKITALNNLTAADPVNDMFPIVDVNDFTMAASGTTKRISVNNLLSSSPTASGALTITGLVTAGSATVTGAATVGTTLGVTGVSTFAAGTALLPALTTTGDTNTGIYYPAADTFAVTTGGTERYRVDSSGNVGVGVTPSAWATYNSVDLKAGGFISSGGDWMEVMMNTYYNGGYKYKFNGFASHYLQQSGAHSWYIAPSGTAGNAITFTQAMTLDATGNLLVGTTAVGMTAGGVRLKNGGGNLGEISLSNNSGVADYVARFVWGSGATLVGNITVSSVATVYNTISDYRLKEAVKPLNGGLTRVNALKPSVYNWKSDGSAGEGFLAHELAEVVPAAVTGEKDAVNADGTIKPQGVDMSRIVPILVAAIQELTARVQTLEAR
jgi:hypothetical protein